MKIFRSWFIFRRLSAGLAAGALVLFPALTLQGCAPSPPNPEIEVAATLPVAKEDLQETPVPVGKWRAHSLAGCSQDMDVPQVVERYLGICSEYYREGSGSDGMIEMELGLVEGHRHSLMLLTLGQLYLMAGQGDPDLLPVEGPAADVGNWEHNRTRLLRRAEELLQEAAKTRLDDAAVDYLLADVERARGNQAMAAELVAAGMLKCTGGRSFGTLWLYQKLSNHSPRYLGGPPPEFPQSALEKDIGGDVVLDVLLSPAGGVRQLVVVESPDDALSKAAGKGLRKGRFEAARVGKYPVWAWLRVTTTFNLEG